MSATMFTSRNDNVTGMDNSRIPVPSTSPFPIRRSNSLRLRGEKLTQHHIRFSAELPTKQTDKDVENYYAKTMRCSTPMNGNAHHPRLGENGMRELRNSLPPAKIGVNGCNHVKTDFRSQNTPKGGLTPTTPRAKTLSLSLSSTKLHNRKSPTISLPSNTPPTSPYGTNQSNLNHEWDLESIGSSTSNLSLSSCDHARIARNGTTFSGKSMRYIFHCNQTSATTGEEYLTPTQRAHRQIKKLKNLLHQARIELEQKDSDILKLTKEVVELRLYKAAINSPEDRSNSSDAVTVRENNSDEQITPESLNGVDKNPNFMDSGGSYVDSGHYEDSNQSDLSKRNSFDHLDSTESPRKLDKSVETCDFEFATSSEQKLILEYEKRIQELIKVHEEENYQIKQKHNDKIEELLARIGDINQRYWQIVPELEAARERIKDLEKQLEKSCKKLEDLEEDYKKTHLELTLPSQGTSKSEEDTQVMDIAKRNPSRLSVPELLQELQVTKNELDNLRAMYRQLIEAKNKNKIDPEITLQFLKSAIYYFLTDKENTNGHLKAIQSILGFSQSEISIIDKAQFQ
ncbi:hypothetical protein WA026_010892 [Henosepilachna vigintioctopunctata]|uniref:GRIP domain-containing protein n=1 Tax=Henosepilachna vigintioctopunctata TaxID=420089 RepID=A0AAW1UY25_9CUCU